MREHNICVFWLLYEVCSYLDTLWWIMCHCVSSILRKYNIASTFLPFLAAIVNVVTLSINGHLASLNRDKWRWIDTCWIILCIHSEHNSCETGPYESCLLKLSYWRFRLTEDQHTNTTTGFWFHATFDHERVSSHNLIMATASLYWYFIGENCH